MSGKRSSLLSSIHNCSVPNGPCCRGTYATPPPSAHLQELQPLRTRFFFRARGTEVARSFVLLVTFGLLPRFSKPG
uniref:Uncharacterized protein n=1 Tax=Steinernema glaseri TaxID=37863 RepID=A0A1I7YYV7_9BILA